jgi:hypothetical protein
VCETGAVRVPPALPPDPDRFDRGIVQRSVAQYPIIAPPSISISTSYPGASPENLYNSVTRLIGPADRV